MFATMAGHLRRHGSARRCQVRAPSCGQGIGRGGNQHGSAQQGRLRPCRASARARPQGLCRCYQGWKEQVVDHAKNCIFQGLEGSAWKVSVTVDNTVDIISAGRSDPRGTGWKPELKTPVENQQRRLYQSRNWALQISGQTLAVSRICLCAIRRCDAVIFPSLGSRFVSELRDLGLMLRTLIFRYN